VDLSPHTVATRLKRIGNVHFLRYEILQAALTTTHSLTTVTHCSSHDRAKIRYLYEMLHISPWNRFPLRVQWLAAHHKHLANDAPEPPAHVGVDVAAIDTLDLSMYCNTADSGTIRSISRSLDA